MKKILASMFLIATIFFIPQVYAEEGCTYKEEAELREKASNIKADYEVKEEILTEETDNLAAVRKTNFIISVLNLTEDFYIEVTNNYNNEKQILSYSNENDGIVTFEWKVSSDVTDFTFKVYTVSGSKCNGIVLNTFHLITPRYNKFYNSTVCRNEFPEYSLCQKYVTSKEISTKDFNKSINAYRDSLNKKQQEEEKNNTFIGKIINFVDNYKWIMLGVVVVSGIGTGTFLYFRRKKQRDLGL